MGPYQYYWKHDFPDELAKDCFGRKADRRLSLRHFGKFP